MKSYRYQNAAGISSRSKALISILLAFLFLLHVIGPLNAQAQDKIAHKVPEKSPLSGRELNIWNNKEFKRQFTESYLAVTDIEPRVSSFEMEKLNEVLEIRSNETLDEMNKLNEAALLLEKFLDKEEEKTEKPKLFIRNLRKEREEETQEIESAVFDFMLANTYYELANLTDDPEKMDQAVDAYLDAIAKHPKFRRAYQNLSLIYIRQGEFEKALPNLLKVVEYGGSDKVVYGLLGYAYSSVENHLAAETAYRMANLLDPETMDWKMGLAESFFRQERYAEAVSLCGQLIKDEPENADLWLLQANAYIGLNKPMEAAKIYEVVDQLGQSTVESLNTLGDIYINEELYEIAATSYIRAMEEQPEGNPERPIRSAKILVVRGALPEAKQLIQRIESVHGDRLAPSDRKEVLKLRARLAVADGVGSEEEVRVLEEIIAIDPLDGEALILLGQHHARASATATEQASGAEEKESEAITKLADEEYAKAIFFYERAAKVEKFEAEAKVRHAQLMVDRRKYAEAIPLLERAQQIEYRQNIQDYLEQVKRAAQNR